MMDETEFIAKMLESFKSDIEAQTTDASTTQGFGSNGTVAWYNYPPLSFFSPINISPCTQQTQTTVDNRKPSLSELQSANTLKAGTRFAYVLGAPTSPATKLSEETLTFLNQGQSYEIELTCMDNFLQYSSLKSVVRVTFNDRRLQFMEKEQLQVWKAERHPTEKLIELDVPLSFGIVCVPVSDDSCSLNTLEFLWNPHQRATVVGIKLNCVSTEFTARKCGGERGVPFRIQIDTYGCKDSQESIADRPLHSAYCLVKVFKPKGAERKLKNDMETFNRLPPDHQKSYRPSLQKTMLTEMSPEEVQRHLSQVNCVTSLMSSALYSSSQNLVQNPLVSTTKLNPSTLQPESPSSEMQPQSSKKFNVCEDMTHEEVSQWMRRNQFDIFIDTLDKYSASDLLCLSRQDFIDICGVAEGIRFCNAVHRRPVRPKLSLYISSQGIDCEADFGKREEKLNLGVSIDSFLLSPACSLSGSSSSGSVLNRTSTINGSLGSSLGSCFGSTVDVRTATGSAKRKRRIESVGDMCDNRSKRNCCHRDIVTNNIYDLVNLDYLTRNHLFERLSVLYGLQSNRISDVYLKTSKGLTVEVTDLVVEHLEDESHFQLEIIQAEVELQPITVLLLKSVPSTQEQQL